VTEPVEALLARMADREPGPRAGAATAVTVGLAAALVELAATLSPSWSEAAGVAAAASAARVRALELADSDTQALVDARLARRAGVEPDADVTAALVDVPLEIAERAVTVAELARSATQHGNPRLAGDSAVAALLAAAAAEAAAGIVALNVGDHGEARVVRAAELAAAARAGRDTMEA
jgi:formiminotetrahydrofolate cyclodeaminase